LRLAGGLGALTDTLADRIPDDRKRLNAAVTQLETLNNHCVARLSTGERIRADHVVLALPPRVAAQIEFSPALPANAVHAMHGIATWMAGQAKAVAVYDTPFWRAEGLSGDAMSRRGPMVEIHDASPASGGPYALFGFVGVPPGSRADEQLLRQDLQAQLIRLFGPQAAEPRQLYFKDWAFDPHTATEADKAPLYAHPTYGLPKAMTDLWDNKLHFAGTEVAHAFGGYIEGALEAAENVLNTLNLQKE
jgi:monoamine oxidase